MCRSYENPCLLMPQKLKCPYYWHHGKSYIAETTFACNFQIKKNNCLSHLISGYCTHFMQEVSVIKRYITITEGRLQWTEYQCVTAQGTNTRHPILKAVSILMSRRQVQKKNRFRQLGIRHIYIKIFVRIICSISRVSITPSPSSKVSIKFCPRIMPAL